MFRRGYYRNYCNFVPSESLTKTSKVINKISGEKAKQLYLEEIENNKLIQHTTTDNSQSLKITCNPKRNTEKVELSNLKLFTSVQNNDVDNIRRFLDAYPDKINIVDEYGWSLLMIASQANSTEVVKELLKRGIDTTVRDKAGNSAQSLIIRNKNVILADILLSYGTSIKLSESVIQEPKHGKRYRENYVCEICNGKLFNDKEEHLSSTLHNINASKGKKIPTNYLIPESNKGYQIMLKVGWDKESGLGPDGSGKKYPIKTIQKSDKKGLGHKKSKKLKTSGQDTTKQPDKKYSVSDYHRNRRMEINFRREFY